MNACRCTDVGSPSSLKITSSVHLVCEHEWLWSPSLNTQSQAQWEHRNSVVVIEAWWSYAARVLMVIVSKLAEAFQTRVCHCDHLYRFMKEVHACVQTSCTIWWSEIIQKNITKRLPLLSTSAFLQEGMQS